MESIITLHCKKKAIISQESRTLTHFKWQVNPFTTGNARTIKNYFIYNPTVLVVSHVSHSNQVSKVSHFSLTK